MPTFTNYSIVGKKESVADVITNISPTDTPFISNIGKDKITNTLFQWQTDALAAPRVNANVEGYTAVSATLAPTTMVSNVTQILEKTFEVTDTIEAISLYGRAKEAAYQAGKASSELKRDLEFACVGTKQTQVLGSSSVVRQFAGAQAQIDPTMIISTGGTTTALSEANITAALQKVYEQGGNPKALMVTPTDSLVVADLARAAGRYREISADGADSKRIVNTVNLYVSPFGEVSVQLNRFLAAGDSIVYDPAMFQLAWLRPWTRETLSKNGDSTRMRIVGEVSLKNKSPLAAAIIRRQT